MAGPYNIVKFAEKIGIAAALIRVWEERYLWPRSTRGPDGHRIYTEGDVVEAEEVKRRLERGEKIGTLIDGYGYPHWCSHLRFQATKPAHSGPKVPFSLLNHLLLNAPSTRAGQEVQANLIAALLDRRFAEAATANHHLNRVHPKDRSLAVVYPILLWLRIAKQDGMIDQKLSQSLWAAVETVGTESLQDATVAVDVMFRAALLRLTSSKTR